MKHAGGVGTIAVSLAVNPDLHFEVRDDGCGFERDQVTSSAGLTNMSDRLAAVGGVLVIRTAPGMGTCVSGTVPLSHNGTVPLSHNGTVPLSHNGSRPAREDFAPPVVPRT
jgi:nitrate/nitrite-specific signal transduction histidine kinase